MTPVLRSSPPGEKVGNPVLVSVRGREWWLVLRAVAALVASVALGVLVLN